MNAPDTDTLAGLREELRLIGCHQNGEARCTCAIGADALDAIDALRAQAAKDKARIERLEARLAAAEAVVNRLREGEARLSLLLNETAQARDAAEAGEDALAEALELIAETESWQANHATDALTAYEARRKG